MSIRNLPPVRRVITTAWLAVVGIQLAIWLAMCLIGWHLPYPFWLWTAAVGGVIVGVIWAIPVDKRGAHR
ncbi:hypothetical protein [Kibdelosporangium phytohabitans]|uniref:DUF2530 domain-containing protein n=1 Tax=Kibdelosporangium phytohabitans TaxID=860235 RepID=A0A0N9I890_9PSEU|nr:hypothetical protein [Kibdelosporangium phytohabitans]ALG12102.1 hypothetical protein AOZ06_39225 [Kibdelosporangium phytohabitans]MBE1463597.1 membrane associated rhomboid family serine protease [Kibdelosporangium phytohabitans]